MDINSIIDNLKTSIASGNNGRIKLTDHSYLLDLLGDNDSQQDENNRFSRAVTWKDYKDHRFPMTWLVMKFLEYIVKNIIFAFYWIASKFRLLFVGKSNERDLSASPRFNFIIFIAVITLYIVAVITMVVFYFSSVLLFNPNSGSNDRGAISIPQPCGEEHYLYLFNTATYWANTGIKVLKGDEVTITASGSFYSNIADMEESAKDNKKMLYQRIFPSKSNSNDSTPDSTKELCMYYYNNKGGKDSFNARFGSLLVQIKDDYKGPDFTSADGHIFQLDTIRNGVAPHFVVDTPGVLNFAVNDIYLSERVMKKLINNYDFIDSLLKNKFYNQPETMLAKIGGMEKHSRRSFLGEKLGLMDSCQLDTFFCKAKMRPELWFDDNVGEILLNITVSHHAINSGIFTPTLFAKSYRLLGHYFGDQDAWSTLLLVIISLFLWFFVDYNMGHYLNREKLGKEY